jgi:hypothetical protein
MNSWSFSISNQLEHHLWGSENSLAVSEPTETRRNQQENEQRNALGQRLTAGQAETHPAGDQKTAVERRLVGKGLASRSRLLLQ